MTEREFAEAVTGMGGQLYVAGGWVRDRIIGRSAKDKDYVVCGLTAAQLSENFSLQQIGQSFPVFQVELDGRECDLALARTEKKTGHGYRGFEAIFSPETTIYEDLRRRDTTMNSIALRLPDMTLIDPFGGRDDIAHRVIRATSEHFHDDPVRALRAARQSAELGFDVDGGTLKLMSECHAELLDEPPERLFGEMTRALSSPDPGRFFAALNDAALLDVLFKDDSGKVISEPAQAALRRVLPSTDRPETRLAALLLASGVSAQAVEEFAARLRFPSQWLRVISFALSCPLAPRREETVELLETIHRQSIDPHEIAEVFRAVYGTTPPFLARYEAYQDFLARERARLVFPASLPPRERTAWLRRQLALALEEVQPSGSAEPPAGGVTSDASSVRRETGCQTGAEAPQSGRKAP